MNRRDLKALVEIRMNESALLLGKKHFDGAYYLCGYAVECALKSCIARKTRVHDFPDRKLVMDSYTHNLNQLIRVAGLQGALDLELKRDGNFAVNWAIVKDWNEESRYERHTATAAKGLYLAVSDEKHGVLRWLKRHW